jgi:hypothetical protein
MHQALGMYHYSQIQQTPRLLSCGDDQPPFPNLVGKQLQRDGLDQDVIASSFSYDSSTFRLIARNQCNDGRRRCWRALLQPTNLLSSLDAVHDRHINVHLVAAGVRPGCQQGKRHHTDQDQAKIASPPPLDSFLSVLRDFMRKLLLPQERGENMLVNRVVCAEVED